MIATLRASVDMNLFRDPVREQCCVHVWPAAAALVMMTTTMPLVATCTRDGDVAWRFLARCVCKPMRTIFARYSHVLHTMSLQDPVLTSEYVKHFSQGLQHGDTNHDDVDPEHLQIISTCKHFFGYDIETGRSGNDVQISPRMLTEYYLPVFKTCIQEAKVKSMMCAVSVPSVY